MASPVPNLGWTPSLLCCLLCLWILNAAFHFPVGLPVLGNSLVNWETEGSLPHICKDFPLASLQPALWGKAPVEQKPCSYSLWLLVDLSGGRVPSVCTPVSEPSTVGSWTDLATSVTVPRVGSGGPQFLARPVGPPPFSVTFQLELTGLEKGVHWQQGSFFLIFF